MALRTFLHPAEWYTCTAIIKKTGQITAIALSEEGHFIAIADSNGVSVHNGDSILSECPQYHRFTGTITALAWLPSTTNADYLVYGTTYGYIAIWLSHHGDGDFRSFVHWRMPIKERITSIASIKTSAISVQVALGMAPGTVILMTYDYHQNARITHCLSHLENAPRALQFSENGTQLYVVCSAEVMVIINCQTGRVIQTLSLCPCIEYASFQLESDSVIVNNSVDGLSIFRLRDGRILKTIVTKGKIHKDMENIVCAYFSSFIVTTTNSGDVYIFDMKTQSDFDVLSHSAWDPVMFLATPTDGSDAVLACASTHSVSIWRRSSGRSRRTEFLITLGLIMIMLSSMLLVFEVVLADDFPLE